MAGSPPLARVRKPVHAARLFRGFAKAASRMVTLALSTASVAARPGGVAGRVTEVEKFGSNPGELRMFVFHPPRPPPPGAPLIIVLHGCRQGAESFATQAGWIDLARSLGIPLVLPEQVMANNRSRCFNWYKPGDFGRDQGEAMSVRQMVRAATRQFGSDRRRVFIVGLSAGGAMAVGMLAAYPAVFAGGAVVAGMPIGAARTSPMALLRMYRADPFRTRAGLVAAVHARTAPRSARPWPRLSIWQGGRDRTVDPANAELLAAQWSALHGLTQDPDSDTTPAPGLRRRCWGRAARPAVELCTLPDLAHGFPVDPRLGGGGRPGPWVLDAGVPAAREIAAFWGLHPSPG